MQFDQVKHFNRALLTGVAAGALLITNPELTNAQSIATPPGIYVEGEGQYVIGDSDFEFGLGPFVPGPKQPVVSTDEGNGWGAAGTLGYRWGNGWNASVRYRHNETDETLGGIGRFYPFVAGSGSGFLENVLSVETDYDTLDFEIGQEFGLGSGHIEIFGGAKYARIDRNYRSMLTTGPQAVVVMSNDFWGVGPKLGARGRVPVASGVSIVGGASIAALFGDAKFSSSTNPGGNPYAANDDRTVAALDAEGGISFAIGGGALTIGYRVDALFGALNTDQGVPPGSPNPIGEERDDFIEHGPFGRFSISLGPAGN